MSNTEKVVTLTIEEAISAISFNEDATAHTFINTGGILAGADHDRSSLVDKMFNADRIEIGGSMCKTMKHAIVVWPKGAKMQSDLLFVASKPERITELEDSK